MNRRYFLKHLFFLPLILTLRTFLWANVNRFVNVKIVGDLDDDLFVMKASEKDWEIIECHQMHNMTGSFYLEGKNFVSKHSPGYIEFQKEYEPLENEYLLIALANERDERDNSKALLARTHYKSAPLYIDEEIAIPSMIPEFNDMPDVPTWYAPDEEQHVYNYYRAWENSIVNIALVFPKEGKYSIFLSSKNGDIVANGDFEINNRIKNIRFTKHEGELDEHPMAEIGGGVYLVEGKKMPNDKLTKSLCPYEMLIHNHSNSEQIRIPFPYPFPYINRIFAKSF